MSDFDYGADLERAYNDGYRDGQKAQHASMWVSVDEIPPEIHKDVLLAVYGHDVIVQKPGESLMDAMKRVRKTVRYTTMGSLGEDGWYGADGYPMVVQPSYWALLPEPPEEEKDA